MKNFILSVALVVTIIACKTETKQETTKPETLENTIWVNAKYLETLERTKSPLQAKPFADTVMINFDAKADTASIVWNFHEGSSYSIKKSEKIQFFDAYEVKPKPEFEATLSNGILKIGNSLFKKVDTTGFIEKKYWIGKYSTPNGNIELGYDGKISGVDSLATYYVWSDYVTTQTDIDLIDLYANSNKSTTYGYKFTGNEIIFYEFIWSEEGIIGKAGKEIFRWKKI
ncbi:hypothetical protein GCM10011514_22000 [Emticicia aquatilis]|uniref:Lipoprotein n=1 Tax=Emticicia aquatilis TaxID=1537369 RepID=A0A916YS59_9BACT|nr:hypothetical protein [Emticicia aquatilis]GGD57491.1 hypothetical protein GCM10011514_22000 [Emticicia aquatilis]